MSARAARRLDVAVRAEAALGEGPTWDTARERLLWVDVLGSRVHGWHPGSGRRTVRTTEQHVGAAKPTADGGLVLNLRDGVAVQRPGGPLRWLHRDPVSGRRGNDAGVAPDGSLWAGTMRYDARDGGGNLTRTAPDGTTRTVLTGVSVSNGIGWSPDGSLMYYVDTPTGRIDVFDVRGQEVAGRRPVAAVESGAGCPDGIAVDADGCVWVALWDGGAVRRYTPDGRLDRTVRVPADRVTACTFGGPGLRDLYLTTARIGTDPARQPLAGSVLVLPDAGQGLPQLPFAG